MPRIPSGSIDLILIDPPYEISRPTNFQNGEETGRDTDRFRISMDFGEWDKNFTGFEVVIKEAYRILRPGGTIICFYDLWKIETLKKFGNVILKIGRYIPNDKSKFDDILGVTLASSNQYAIRL